MRSRLLEALAVIAALAMVGSRDASAQSPPSPPSPSPAPSPAPPRRFKPALASLAAELAKALDKAPSRALIVAGALASDAQAPRAAELTASLAAQLAGKRGKASRSKPEPATLAAARDAARADGSLVYLTVVIASGSLRVTADVYPVPKSVWAKVRDPEPGPMAHAFAEAPLDAEVRAFLAPIPLVAATIERAKNFESDVVAIACGDLDQDGSLEIVSVSRRRVTSLRLRGGKVLPMRSRNWPDLSPVAPAPWREPIGFATLVARGTDVSSWLDVGITDRAKSVRFDGELRTIAVFPGLAVPDGDGTACMKLGGLTLTGPVSACAPSDPAALSANLGGHYDALASAALVSSRGVPYVVWAGRDDRVLEVRDDAGHRATIEGAGAQLAVADLDQDGEPEVIASLDTLNPLDDAVVVRTWSRNQVSTPANASSPAANRIHEVLRIPAPAGVRAIGACPPDGPGRAPFVVATTDEIWVVR